jgi:hypothetical protein
MGIKNYDRLCANIDTMIKKYYMKDKITLGINFYRQDFNFDFYYSLLKKYDFKNARFSITVPNLTLNHGMDPCQYFNKIKPAIKKFFTALLNDDIQPVYDCNRMPGCIFTDSDLQECLPQKYFLGGKTITDYKTENTINIISDWVQCGPVIDILPDLSVIRCFGLSGHTKEKIENFENLESLYNYYLNSIDSFACNTASSAKCYNCHKRKIKLCMGGCLVYKISDILKAKSYCEESIKAKEKKSKSICSVTEKSKGAVK